MISIGNLLKSCVNRRLFAGPNHMADYIARKWLTLLKWARHFSIFCSSVPKLTQATDDVSCPIPNCSTINAVADLRELFFS